MRRGVSLAAWRTRNEVTTAAAAKKAADEQAESIARREADPARTTTAAEPEKEAEANVIRRREETAATRALLNTAKVMAENPVMLRLKELEALDGIAGKVERLTVHNGTGGLMNDLVRLRD